MRSFVQNILHGARQLLLISLCDSDHCHYPMISLDLGEKNLMPPCTSTAGISTRAKQIWPALQLATESPQCSLQTFDLHLSGRLQACPSPPMAAQTAVRAKKLWKAGHISWQEKNGCWAKRVQNNCAALQAIIYSKMVLNGDGHGRAGKADAPWRFPSEIFDACSGVLWSTLQFLKTSGFRASPFCSSLLLPREALLSLPPLISSLTGWIAWKPSWMHHPKLNICFPHPLLHISWKKSFWETQQRHYM